MTESPVPPPDARRGGPALGITSFALAIVALVGTTAASSAIEPQAPFYAAFVFAPINLSMGAPLIAFLCAAVMIASIWIAIVAIRRRLPGTGWAIAALILVCLPTLLIIAVTALMAFVWSQVTPV